MLNLKWEVLVPLDNDLRPILQVLYKFGHQPGQWYYARHFLDPELCFFHGWDYVSIIVQDLTLAIKEYT